MVIPAYSATDNKASHIQQPRLSIIGHQMQVKLQKVYNNGCDGIS